MPTSANQARSRKLLKEAFADELKDRSPTARRTLATKLLAEADKAADNPCDRFVLLVGACDAATEGSDLRLAGRAAEAAASLFTVNAVRLSTDRALRSPLKVATRQQAHDDVEVGLEWESALVQADDYATAGRLLTALQPVAAADAPMAAALKERGRQLGEMRLARDRADAAMERLTTAPNDAVANTALGEFLCFIKGDFEHGLPYMARSDDADMSAAAKRDLVGASDSGRQVAIGDSWWDLADGGAAWDFSKLACGKGPSPGTQRHWLAVR